MGKPIEINNIIENPSDEQVKELHQIYMTELEKLFHEYKSNNLTTKIKIQIDYHFYFYSPTFIYFRENKNQYLREFFYIRIKNDFNSINKISKMILIQENKNPFLFLSTKIKIQIDFHFYFYSPTFIYF